MAQKTLTAVGNAQLDTAQVKFGTASLLCDGTTDGATIPDDADFNFAAGNFTVEFFVRFNSTAALIVLFEQFNTATRSIAIYWNTDNTLHFAYSTDGTTSIDTGRSWTPSTNTWYHVAFVRNGNNGQLYVDGTAVGTVYDLTGLTIFNSTATVGIGLNSQDSAYSLNGWLDELRVGKLARYTANFTPTTSQFTYDANNVLLCHFDGTDGSTTFTDSSADTSDVSGGRSGLQSKIW